MFANAKNSSDDIIIRLIMDINTTIQKKSLAEEVSSLIREQINDGKLTKGEKLPTEPELMKLFGVGRSTVREAIKMLVNMGYLSVQQGRGTFVESVTETNEPFHQRLKYRNCGRYGTSSRLPLPDWPHKGEQRSIWKI